MSSDASYPDGWRAHDPTIDPNPPVTEWRYFICFGCRIVHDGIDAAYNCCPGQFLPLPVAPIEPETMIDEELGRIARGDAAH